MPAQSWLPDLIYTDGRFQSDRALVCDGGKIVDIVEANKAPDAVRLNRRALLPGMVNAHSHAFQRVIRGRTEHRSKHTADSFWTWREQMYAAANRLGPEEIYAASRLAFLEMALTGITAVGEFHYIHHDRDGSAYDDPNLLAREVIRAAHDVGIRIALLRVAYARAGYQAVLAIEAMTLTLAETPPRTADEVTQRANESVAARIKQIAARFAEPGER